MQALKKIAVTILSCALVLSTQSINLFADESVEVKQTATAETFVTEANFPDANFRAALLKENIQTKEDVESITSLDLRFNKIRDLTGIEYFTNLESLKVSFNELSSLDVSKNLKLTYLDAGNNQLMTEITLPNSLKYLDCFDNGIKSIDLLGLSNLWYLNMTANSLSTIDLSGNPELTHLFLEDNNLTKLDLSHQINLDPYFFSLYKNLLTEIQTPNIMKTFSASNFYQQKDDVGYEREWKQNGISLTAEDEVLFDGSTLVSEVTPKKYQILYHANDGTNSTKAEEHTYGEVLTLSANTFTHNGYTFQGWSSSKNSATPEYSDLASVTLKEYPTDGVLNLYAVWSGNPHSVRFHASNGSADTVMQKFVYGSSTRLQGNSFTYEGKHFVGWSTSADGKVSYADKAVIYNLTNEKDAVVDLYAVWEDNVYNVSFDANGGKLVGSSTQSVKYNQVAQKPSDPVKVGYTFKGWLDKNTNTMYDFETPVTSNVTLQAVWNKNTYQIVFDNNSGTGSMNSVTVSYDTSVSLPANQFTKEGYVFSGWSLTPNGGVIYNNLQSVINLTSKDNDTVTLYAKWAPVTYQISYQLNGGNATANPTSYNITSSTITLKNPTRTGHSFGGWYSDSKYQTKVTQIAQGSVGNKTLYARWTPVTYQISYQLNGGNGAVNPTSYNITSSTITLKNPTRTGYSFGGWYSDSKYQTRVTQIAQGSVGNKTLYAKWTPVTYHISYQLNGGNGAANPTNYNITSSTITLKNPTRTGYSFGGWYSDSRYQTRVTQITQGSVGNKTLYAKWTPTKYNIRYVLNGGKAKGNPTSYSITSKSISLKYPTRKGYTFSGWYSDSKYRTKVTKISSGSTGNKTLYAKWTKVAKPSKVNLKSAKNIGKNKLSVSYASVKKASGYQIAYSTSSKFTKSTTKYTSSKTISKLKKGKTYYVKVRAYRKDSTGAKVYGSYSKVIKVKIKK